MGVHAAMQLRALDWAIIIGFFALNVAIGLAFARRAGGSTSDFFLSGRNVPWWLAGTSMVATTFGADTPLAVTGMVARSGIAGNWLWWSSVASGMLTVFFFAALWRRAGVMTDVELIELRYAGRSASGAMNISSKVRSSPRPTSRLSSRNSVARSPMSNLRQTASRGLPGSGSRIGIHSR